MAQMLKDTGVEATFDEQEARQVLNISPSHTQFWRTPDGEVYGFVKDGRVYLDMEKLNPNAPVHEYGHLWSNALMKAQPELWAHGKEMMKNLPLWREVENDPAYADIRNDEDLVASEVFSRLLGDEGEAMLDDMVKQTKHRGALELEWRRKKKNGLPCFPSIIFYLCIQILQP